MKCNWAVLKTYGLIAAATLCLGMSQASAQSVTLTFEDLTDDGFGKAFSNDASMAFPIVNVGGSNRMQITRTGGFQEADINSNANPFLAAFNAATANPSGYVISYDYYLDTSAGGYGTFLQVGTYINSGQAPFTYTQDFPAVKDVDLSGAQLASGGVFSGTVTETLTAKYGALAADFQNTPSARLGLIVNGNGTADKVYFDNISIRPIPEPTSLALLGLGAFGVAGGVLRRRRG